MSADKPWTLRWNAKAKQFIARYRHVDDSGWGTQRIPRSVAAARRDQLTAERWMVQWYADHARTGGLAPVVHRISPVAKTLKMLVPRWLDYRRDDRGTAISTYAEFKKVARNWILDGGLRSHYSIQDLDMECDFTSEVCLAWVRSLRGKGTTPLRYAQVLKVLFEDCIAHAWLDPDMNNPFQRPIVAKEFRRLKQTADEGRAIVFLTADQAAGLLTRQSSKVEDVRRLRYLVVLAAGLRDKELQGLVWSDVRLDDAMPHLRVERQLLRNGPKPFVQYETLRDAGASKADILGQPNALVGLPKRKSRRVIPLHSLAVEGLRYWKATGWKQHVGVAPRADDPVFPNGKDSGHYPAGRFYIVSSAALLRLDLDRLGLPSSVEGRPLSFQALRRTFATLLAAGGVERSSISELLGHKAKDVASLHYVGDVLASRAPLITKLGLPDHVQLRAKSIYVRGAIPKDADGNVIELPRERMRRRVARRQN